jgi:hypothetical protein
VASISAGLAERAQSRPRIALALVVSLPLVILVGPRVMLEAGDAWAAWTSPETESGVARLRVEAAASDFRDASLDTAIADFDGDGTRDELELRYYPQRRPYAARDTSGLLLVTSGATGDVLLGLAIPTPIDRAHWCGDVDDNGTQDVYVETPEPLVLGFVGGS